MALRDGEREQSEIHCRKSYRRCGGDGSFESQWKTGGRSYQTGGVSGSFHDHGNYKSSHRTGGFIISCLQPQRSVSAETGEGEKSDGDAPDHETGRSGISEIDTEGTGGGIVLLCFSL